MGEWVEIDSCHGIASICILKNELKINDMNENEYVLCATEVNKNSSNVDFQAPQVVWGRLRSHENILRCGGAHELITCDSLITQLMRCQPPHMNVGQEDRITAGCSNDQRTAEHSGNCGSHIRPTVTVGPVTVVL